MIIGALAVLIIGALTVLIIGALAVFWLLFLSRNNVWTKCECPPLVEELSEPGQGCMGCRSWRQNSEPEQLPLFTKRLEGGHLTLFSATYMVSCTLPNMAIWSVFPLSALRLSHHILEGEMPLLLYTTLGMSISM